MMIVAIDGILLLIIVFIVAVPFVVIGGFLFNKKSYRNDVWIARQTGANLDDVIWIKDKFKVLYVDGNWILKFYNMKERTPSVNGSYWTKFMSPKFNNRLMQIPKEEWHTLDMRGKLKRGLFLYETTEGEFYPMGINTKDQLGKDIKLTIFNQDNRSFVASETQDVNSLTRNKNKDKLVLIAIIIGIVAMVIIGGMIIYFQNKNHESSIQATAQLCGQYTVNIINALTNVNNTGTPRFIGDLKPVLSLPPG
jgi:flagellar basal body-associated protein FliL